MGRRDTELTTEPGTPLASSSIGADPSRLPARVETASRLSRAVAVSGRPRLGDYELSAQITTRSSVEIFLANRVTRLGFVHRAIVKRATDEVGRRRLFEEARDFAFLAHPSIPPLLDLGEEGSGLWLARGFVDGADLASVIAKLRSRSEALPLELACWMAAEILRGLHQAHTANTPDGRPLEVLHHAVSPSGVLISRSGHLTLIDFGKPSPAERSFDLALPPGEEPEALYLAPELVERRPGDVRTDIYMAGMVLFELLVGRPCYKGRTTGEVLEKITRGEARLERLEQEGVPPELRRIVERAASPTPARRFATCAEMANALETWVMQSNLHPSPWILSAFCQQHELLDPLPSFGTRPVPAPAPEPIRASQPVPRSPQVASPSIPPPPLAPPTPRPPPSIAPAAPRPTPSVAPAALRPPASSAPPRGVPAYSSPPRPAAAVPSILPTPPPLPPRAAAAPVPSSPPLGDDFEEMSPEARTLPSVGGLSIPADATTPNAPIPRPSQPVMRPGVGVPWSGDLSTMRPSEVLGRLITSRVTGRLELRADPLWKHLFLIEGQACAIRSNIGMESIGEQLVRAKLIQRFDLDRALRESLRGEAGVPDRLLELGVIEAPRLAAELGKNVATGLNEAFGWRLGSFDFSPLAVEEERVVPAIDLMLLVTRDTSRSRPGQRPVPPEASTGRPSVEPPQRPSLIDAIELARQAHQSPAQGRVEEVAPEGGPRRRR
ncbi:MAG: protein kinase [Deltaproteobacteria bacterium]|nr:protein kinase [Deltaproteobacteria bacterium]